MFTSTGVIRYYDEPYKKLVVTVDPEIGRYYFSQVPKYVYLRRQMWPTHISVVRKQTPKNMEFWKKHEGRIVEFGYDHFVYNDDVYWWLNAWCPELEQIRVELGLPVCDGITRSPDGRHRFHITIGNTKDPR